MSKKILIIGGMRPQASLALHKELIKQAAENGATKGTDYPAITHVSIPAPEFYEKRDDKQHSLKVISEHLEHLWPSFIYPCGDSM